MAYEFKLPDLGEGLTEGEVARWLVTEGQEIAEDDPLVEIQTDKATVEIPSPAAGVVSRILVAEGEVVPVGTVLVAIGGDGESTKEAVPGSDPGHVRERQWAGTGNPARPQGRPGAGHRDRLASPGLALKDGVTEQDVRRAAWLGVRPRTRPSGRWPPRAAARCAARHR